MPEPTDTDDGWADLYRELGVESAPKPAAPAHPAPAHYTPPQPTDELDEEVGGFDAADVDDAPEVAYAEAEEAAGDGEEDGSDLDAPESGAEGEDEEVGVVAEGEGEPGEPGTKKRRRRRRRRKKGAGPDGAEAATAGAAGEEGEPVAVAEDAHAPESGRDLIANWNVPSWEQIVAGLYRPDR